MATANFTSDDILSAFLSWNDVAKQVRAGTASAGVYRRALGHPHHEVRSLAARHLDHRAEAMAIAAGDTSQAVRLVAATSKATPPEAIATLIGDRTGAVRIAVARRHDLDERTCLVMACDPEDEVRLEIARGPRSPLVLERLLQDRDFDVQRVALTNPRLAHDVQLNLAYYGDDFQRSTLAERSKVPEVLEVLANDREVRIRHLAAANLDTPLDLAIALAERNRDLRRLVLKGRYTWLPEAVLRRYVDEFMALPGQDYRNWLRHVLPLHTAPLDITEPPDVKDHRRLFEVVDRGLPYDLIEHAVTDPAVDPRVRAELITHPDVPLSTVGRALNARSSVLRQAAEDRLRSVLERRHQFRTARD